MLKHATILEQKKHLIVYALVSQKVCPEAKRAEETIMTVNNYIIRLTAG